MLLPPVAHICSNPASIIQIHRPALFYVWQKVLAGFYGAAEACVGFSETSNICGTVASFKEKAGGKPFHEIFDRKD